MTPTQRSRSWLKQQGYRTGDVERYISPKSFTGHGYSSDLFGCIDMIAVRPGELLAVQVCGTDWSPHIKKMTEGSGRDGVELWLSSGSPLLLLGWRKLKMGWCPRIHFFAAEDFGPAGIGKAVRTYEQWQSLQE